MDYYDLKPDQGFLISQKALIVQQEKMLVLMLPDGQWELPGGLLDFGEELKSGLIREVMEETGLAVEVLTVVEASQHQSTRFMLRDERALHMNFVIIAFVCSVTGGDFRLSHEHQDYRWVTREELRPLPIAPNSQAAIARYLSTNIDFS